MTSSIRTFLLVNLLLSATLITSLAIVGNLFLQHRGFQSHLDSQLSLTGHTLSAMTSEHTLTPRLLREIQQRLDHFPSHLNGNHPLASSDRPLTELVESIQFQLWNSHGKLLLHSYAAPVEDVVGNARGFRNIWVDGNPWRTFTLYTNHATLRVVVMQRHDTRLAIEQHITTNSMLMVLMTYPFLGLMIWIIVGRGLESINRAAKAIQKRAPNHLTPLRLPDRPTELNPLVDAINDLLNRLRMAFEREQRFAGDAAHELRTPLAALTTQAQVALKAERLDDAQAALRKVIMAVERSTHVVQQLLTLSRMVPDASINEPEPVNLKPLAITMIQELLPLAHEKGSELVFNADDHLPTLMANPTALLILMRNLLDNALRYSPEGSTIEVHLFQHNHNVTFRVIDNGPGIPEHMRERVFERFYRALGTQTRGSGLGLGIVRQIVDLHRATITLGTPTSGQGLQVDVTFDTRLMQPPQR